jgi:hypothetical protein
VEVASLEVASMLVDALQAGDSAHQSLTIQVDYVHRIKDLAPIRN